MTPEQLPNELTDNRVDSGWNSAGRCSHDMPLYLQCEACAVERVTARYRRHTVEIQWQPMSVEDEIADPGAGLGYAKYLLMFLLGLAVGYVLARWIALHQGGQ